MRAGPSSTSDPSGTSAPSSTSASGNRRQQATISPPVYPGQQNQSVTHLTKMDMEDRIKKYWEFKCPTFELVLLDFFKGFPNITDMSCKFYYSLIKRSTIIVKKKKKNSNKYISIILSFVES